MALLVVDAGEFEKGFEGGGQTLEHILLVRSLGVSQVIVAVSKKDKVDNSQQCYEEIRKKLGRCITAFLIKTAGFRKKCFQFIPCSGLTGENLMKPSTAAALTKWYSGPNLTTVEFWINQKFGIVKDSKLQKCGKMNLIGKLQLNSEVNKMEDEGAIVELRKYRVQEAIVKFNQE